MRRLNPDALFAAVDEARERKYGPIDAHRQTVGDPSSRDINPDESRRRCEICARLLPDSRMYERRKCNICINTNRSTSRRNCVVCGALERRSTPANRKDNDYYCPDCRPVYLKMYDKTMRKKARP